MRVGIEVTGLDGAMASLSAFSERRLNAAVATALTRTVRKIGDAWQDQLGSVFDRPTRATQNAAFVRPAQASAPVAEAFIRDRAAGTPPVEWLAPNEFGGARRVKKFEAALVAQGSMPAGMRAVPGPGAVLDSYGNVSRGQIIQVLSQLGAQYSPGYARVISASAEKRAAKALASGRKYIAIPRDHGKLEAGIYRREGGRQLVPIFYFTRAATYRPRSSLLKQADAIAVREFGAQLRTAIRESAARLSASGRR